MGNSTELWTSYLAFSENLHHSLSGFVRKKQMLPITLFSDRNSDNSQYVTL